MGSVGEKHLNTLMELGLKEYEAKTLTHLLQVGETKAPKLSSISRVPKARIYGILEGLADRGLVEIKPGRPSKYRPKPPKEIIERMIQNRKNEMENEIEKIRSVENDFVSQFKEIYESSIEKSREPLLKTVSVGDPSENETQLMYKDAEEEINIVSKSMEWLPEVIDTLKEAIKRGIKVKALFLSRDLLEEENVSIQEKSIKTFKEDLPEAKVRFSKGLLPLRGSIVDPSYEYESGQAIFLVEEKSVPLKLRDAAITENPSLVAGMKRYFDLIWKHESRKEE